MKSISTIENWATVVYTVKIMDKEKKSSGKKNLRAAGIGLILWLTAAFILLMFFLVNQKKIASNLKTTNFFDKMFGKTPSFIENAPVIEPPQEKNEIEPVAPVTIDLTGGKTTAPSEPVIQDYFAGRKNNNDTHSEVQEPAKTPAEAVPEVAEVKAENYQTMTLKLFFMTINSDGSITRKEMSRIMKKSQSPLRDAINALIEGPDEAELKAGCRTLISKGTKLRGASVKDGIAVLNFSGEFEFNQYGIEGSLGQLQQIVYTATAFPTVESVLFLIDGEKKEYLSSEGVWIGSPLNRSNF